jgi:transcriptional regulator with XRE-family HTH domain
MARRRKLGPGAPEITAKADPKMRGKRLRWLLKRDKWKGKDFAPLIGMTPPDLSKMLTGLRPIETSDALRISIVLGVPPGFVLWGERDRLEPELKKRLPPNL